MQELGQAGARADEHGLEAVVKELVHGDGLADDGVVDDLDAHLGEVLDLGGHDLFRETELGNAVDENAAALMEGLEDGHVIAHLAEVARAGQARGAGADDGDLMAVLDRDGGFGLILAGHVPVGDKALETADADAFALDAADALRLALLFLGADTAADGGQRVRGGHDLVGGLKIALADLLEEARDLDGHGAAFAAGRILAVEAAGGFLFGGFGVIAEGNLVKVAGTDNGILFRHLVLCHAHIDLQISHCASLP